MVLWASCQLGRSWTGTAPSHLQDDQLPLQQQRLPLQQRLQLTPTNLIAVIGGASTSTTTAAAVSARAADAEAPSRQRAVQKKAEHKTQPPVDFKGPHGWIQQLPRSDLLFCSPSPTTRSSCSATSTSRHTAGSSFRFNSSFLFVASVPSYQLSCLARLALPFLSIRPFRCVHPFVSTLTSRFTENLKNCSSREKHFLIYFFKFLRVGPFGLVFAVQAATCG